MKISIVRGVCSDAKDSDIFAAGPQRGGGWIAAAGVLLVFRMQCRDLTLVQRAETTISSSGVASGMFVWSV
ncbi:hypothetical protein ACG10_12750 [Azotobacter chroococcum]|nr:hypothetical protein ACG10_12750 [Azotobacter chroococcum]